MRSWIMKSLAMVAALFMLVGTSSCTSLVGFVLPIGSKPNEHGFYHVLIGVLLAGDLLLACVETNYELPKKTTPLADADVMVTVAEATDDSESDVSIQQPHAVVASTRRYVLSARWPSAVNTAPFASLPSPKCYSKRVRS